METLGKDLPLVAQATGQFIEGLGKLTGKVLKDLEDTKEMYKKLKLDASGLEPLKLKAEEMMNDFRIKKLQLQEKSKFYDEFILKVSNCRTNLEETKIFAEEAVKKGNDLQTFYKELQANFTREADDIRKELALEIKNRKKLREKLGEGLSATQKKVVLGSIIAGGIGIVGTVLIGGAVTFGILPALGMLAAAAGIGWGVSFGICGLTAVGVGIYNAVKARDINEFTRLFSEKQRKCDASMQELKRQHDELYDLNTELMSSSVTLEAEIEWNSRQAKAAIKRINEMENATENGEEHKTRQSLCLQMAHEDLKEMRGRETWDVIEEASNFSESAKLIKEENKVEAVKPKARDRCEIL